MGDLLTGIDFAAKSRKYTREAEPTLEQMAVGIIAELMPDTAPCELIYESSIGHVAPEKDPA